MIVVETEKHRYSPGSNVWWDVAPAEVSADDATQRLRADRGSARTSSAVLLLMQNVGGGWVACFPAAAGKHVNGLGACSRSPRRPSA